MAQKGMNTRTDDCCYWSQLAKAFDDEPGENETTSLAHIISSWTVGNISSKY